MEHKQLDIEWRATNELRFKTVIRNGIFLSQSGVLQQKFYKIIVHERMSDGFALVYDETDELEWRDIPTVLE